MSSPSHRLDRLLQKAKRLGRFDDSAVRDVLATTRELIEVGRLQSQFPIATLYCNWSLHSQISASVTALRCLESITLKLIQIRGPGQSVDGFIAFLSGRLFQTDLLRSELLQIWNRNALPTFLITYDQNWRLFLALLFNALVGKRLQYPPGADLPEAPSDSESLKKSKKIYANLLAAVGGVRRQVFKAAWISWTVDPWDERPQSQRIPVLHCNIEAFDGPVFVLKMTNVDAIPEADEYLLVG